ncbi:MAG TPA: choice-of-anchor D domain-containing protein [Rubricoccaceae bacterium]|jgi:hypothetical protein
MSRSFLTPALVAVLALTSSSAFAQSGKTSTDTKPVESSSQFVPPANDNFANAIVITAAGEYLSSTVDATAEPGEPTIPAACGTDNTNQSVWFKFTGTGSTVTFDTAGSPITAPSTGTGVVDTILSIYSGTTLAGLTQVACNDDDPTNTTPGDFTSRLANVPTTAGTTYYVRVSAFQGGAGSPSDRANGQIRLAASGTFVPPTGPSLVASPGTVAFGTVRTTTTSAPQTVTLTNNGTAAVTITSITGSGAPFTVNTTGTSLTLAPGATTTFSVTFSPTAGGAATGSVTIASNAAGSPLVVALTGTGDANFTSQIPSGTTIGAPTFNRPSTAGTGASGSCTVPTTGTGTGVVYRPLTFTVTAAGNYTITANFSGNTPAYDGFILLYRTAFNAADQCLNLIAFDDDFAINGAPALQGAQIANQALTAGTYVLVMTAYNNTYSGTYTGTIVGPSAAQFATAGEGTASNGRASLSAAPNPVAGTATVRFVSETSQDVSVVVYDVTGRQVATLFTGAVAADQEVVARLEASSLPSGVYVIRASGTDLSLTQRVTVVR